MRHKGHRNRFLCPTQNRILVSKKTVPCPKTNKTSLCFKQNLIDIYLKKLMESLQHSYLEIKNINITMITHCMNPPTMERVMFLWWKHWSTWKKRIMHWQEKKSAFIHHFFWNLWRPKPEGGGRPEDREEWELSEGGEEQWGDGTVLFTTASMLLMWMCVECSFLAVLSAVLQFD